MLIVGIIGAYIGGFLVSSLLGFRYVEGMNVPSIIVATLGAVILLTIAAAFEDFGQHCARACIGSGD